MDGSPLLSLSRIPQRLKDKVAVITGGVSGIGAATARHFAKHGAKVVIADIQTDLGNALVEQINSELESPTAATYVHCDVTNESDVETAVSTAVSTHEKLDIMFSNAGIGGRNNMLARIADVDRADLERVFAVNVYGGLKGKVALITGGTSGIGAAAARLFANHGANVVVADVQSDDKGAKQFGPSSVHPSITYVHCDVSKESDVQNAVDAAVSAHGKLDVMFSNAGVVGRNNLVMNISELDSRDVDQVFAVNVYGALYAAKHAARVMIPQKSGSIVFTASYVTAAFGDSGHAYTASKHAVVGLMKNLSVELGGHGIRVNSVSPFGVATPLVLEATGVTDPKIITDGVTARVGLGGAVLEADDVAEAALYLFPAIVNNISFHSPSIMTGSSLLSPIAQRLKGKVAVITGGASGVGAATAKHFAKHGAKVVIADIQTDLGHALVEQINSELETPDAATYVHCDVTVETDVETAVSTAVSTYGKLDIMFSNAGIGGQNNILPKITDVDRADLERVFAVNVYGGFFAAKYAAKAMIPRNSGCILFTASSVTDTHGISAHPYSASKTAVVGLMKNLCVELGQYGIRVNAVSPCGLATPFTVAATGITDLKLIEHLITERAGLKGAVLRVDDVAEAALYLASEESQFVSGMNILLDAGLNLRGA
ncbi:Short chain aldehyde dehydrogenase 1 [Linum perenne]